MPEQLDGVQQIFPSLEVSGCLGENREPVVAVERKQWDSCKTLRLWTVGQQDDLNGYKCTLRGPTPAKLEIRIFTSLPGESSASYRLQPAALNQCFTAAMAAAAASVAAAFFFFFFKHSFYIGLFSPKCGHQRQLAPISIQTEMLSNVQVHQIIPVFTTTAEALLCRMSLHTG